MSINGVHLLLYSPEADALRAALRQLFDGVRVEAHPGWTIVATPPAEIGVHPGATPHHEISLMCDDLDATVEHLSTKGILTTGHPQDRRFGRAVTLALPGGVELLLYEPSHPTALGVNPHY